MSFWDAALPKARQYREVVVGYRPAELDYDDAEEAEELNPPNKSVPRRWKKRDKIVTFSFDKRIHKGPFVNVCWTVY